VDADDHGVVDPRNYRPLRSPAAVALSVQFCRFVDVEPPDGDLAYANMSAAARGVSVKSVDDPVQLRSVFDLAEAILDHAEPELQTLVVVGFLEDLQNYLLRGEGDGDVVLSLLGPRSRLAWEAVERAWAGDAGAIDRVFQGWAP
jgi:hypothetical protein